MSDTSFKIFYSRTRLVLLRGRNVNLVHSFNFNQLFDFYGLSFQSRLAKTLDKIFSDLVLTAAQNYYH